jgi:ABC-2 type transport system ATP-binding protein
MSALIECKELSFSTSAKPILKNLTFSIPEGSLSVVIGENGSGKTTLLKLLVGLYPPSKGQLTVFGNTPSEDPYLDRHKMAYISEKLTPPMDWSAQDFFEFNRYFFKNYSIKKEQELKQELKVADDSRLGLLSAGEIRRVQVVAALAARPELLLIDEITAVLDIVGRARFNQILKTIQIENPNTTILMATNILDDVDQYASHLLLLNQGELKFYKPLAEVKAQSPTQSLTEILAKQIEEDSAA